MITHHTHPQASEASLNSSLFHSLPPSLSSWFPPVLCNSSSVTAFGAYNPRQILLEKQILLVRLLTRTQQRERLPRSCRKLHLPTTQAPLAHQHQGTLSHNPHPPSADLSLVWKLSEERREPKKGGGGSKALYCKKKRFVSPGSLPPPLKTISCNSKKQSRENKAEEVRGEGGSLQCPLWL